MDRRALPGLLACLVGLLLSVIALLTGDVWWVAGAAVAVVVAAAATFGLLGRLDEVSRRESEVEALASRAREESDRMAARAAHFEAEAIEARSSLEEALRRSAGPSAPGRTGGSTETAGDDDAPPVVDAATGLFTERFFTATLDKRVSAARRGLRPLAVGIIEVVHRDGDTVRPADPKIVADALTHTLRDADTCCRLDDGRFGVVLEDTPENGAVWTIERFRRRVVEGLGDATMWAGLSCYPAHAFAAEDLLAQARRALGAASEWRQDRIEVAGLPDD
ncbi:MAG: diguanylate cyclase [Actinobacteria bacterium]|nr:diguanylate cyclase [Actinomycetota bacterium]